MVILSKLEQEYLLRTIESGVELADLRQLFLWAQGPLQALLPHEVLLCMQLDGSGQVQRSECLHRAVLDGTSLGMLRQALGPLLAQAWRAGRAEPATLEVQEGGGPLASCRSLLRSSGFENVLVHGSAAREGAATVFALFGLPFRPGARHAYFLQLLMPYLHLALLRMPAGGRLGGVRPARALSGREVAVLERVREGCTNEEVAELLGISALTVKNHLQRVYRVLGVANRAHAVARCLELRLL
ncbi:LuxR C-terminal-related transcriptional regulator [Massilia niastensis]|uniref:LuxR C-terminal-related transcriptional regulator n=1 Tax=Massilia niastensis TaxID=544911 RepID=UPI00036CB4B0|nr:LuxR C-terminal-related transcriptional regulator [Massilia niastensis]